MTKWTAGLPRRASVFASQACRCVMWPSPTPTSSPLSIFTSRCPKSPPTMRSPSNGCRRNTAPTFERGSKLLATSWQRTTFGANRVARCFVQRLTPRWRDAMDSCCRRSPFRRRASGNRLFGMGTRDEPVRNVMLRLTQLFNITGHPVIAVPCGVTSDALPISLQIVGRIGATPDLLDIARALEPRRHSGTRALIGISPSCCSGSFTIGNTGLPRSARTASSVRSIGAPTGCRPRTARTGRQRRAWRAGSKR